MSAISKDSGDVDGSHWAKAAHLTRQWLNVDLSSIDAYTVTSKAITLLQAVIVHLSLTEAQEVEIIDSCRIFLEDEIRHPGSRLDQLTTSDDSGVRAVSAATLKYGGAWVKLTEPRNLIVMTALLGLPGSLRLPSA
ncbi:hypothetical protein [Actinoplanes sp. NBRC 103695]|uniref:hypothetical protein n=1 Tax=Actinoplanes sp. NBRC 103695 TaxID=3032202 RepID=UPI0024A02745|nr:hypothetical protein [Actinoplanes sp. NBRC 103695]GLY96560.1 hypothetical protein Acsp02_38150 [Actinoplanes sp. NBRC 103695]